MARLNPGECNMIYVMHHCSQVIVEYCASSRPGASRRPLSLAPSLKMKMFFNKEYNPTFKGIQAVMKKT